MSEIWSSLIEFFTAERFVSLIRAFTILIIGLFLARLISSSLVRLLSKHTSAQQAMLIKRISFYLLAGLIVMSSLREMGFQLGVLLGAAGIFTVALGFASQTSASNVISGLFLLAEKPFVVGDIIKVGDTVGVVLAIELVSVKLRTFDNALVRIPNESIVKSQIFNYTHFPIRRIDIEIGVAYKEDIARVREVLMEVADRNPLCLEEPLPLIIFKGYGDSSINLLFCVWGKKENYLPLVNSIKEEVKKAFDEKGIEIPFPHRTLYTGSVTEPFPITIVNNP
ncbi:mechanosensitive ion channel family protein [Gemmatimonadota bacterium]